MSEATPAHPRTPEPAHGHTEPTPHHHVNYIAVFGVLVVLTVVTVAVAFIPGIKSELVKVLIALAIASVKASAVVIYFMHMKYEGKLIYLILLLPLSFCILLVVALLPDVTFAPIFHEFLAAPWRHANH